MRILQIGSDRSKRGILQKGSAAYLRQQAYADGFGNLDIIAFSLKSDEAPEISESNLHIVPTDSTAKWAYGLDAISIAKKLSKPDVVSAQDPFEAGLVALRIARHFRIPLHVQIHTDFLDPSFAKHSILNKLRVRMARYVLMHASGIRVVSEHIKKSLLEAKWPLKCEPSALPIFSDTARLKTLLPSSALRARFERYVVRLLVVARLESEKRVSLAIDSFARLGRDDVCLIIVGDGSERGALEMQVQALGMGSRVYFEGGVEAAPYYHLADLVLVTSAYEGYGLVIVEALSMGKPVLSVDVGVAREAGAIVAPVALFAEALKKWFDHGAREGVLRVPSSASFDEYARAYCDDIERLAK